METPSPLNSAAGVVLKILFLPAFVAVFALLFLVAVAAVVVTGEKLRKPDF